MVDVVKGTKQEISQDGADKGADKKDTLGRVGLVGRGVVYAVVGLLALQLALGRPDQQASTEGAFAWIASQPFGKFLLIALTMSLFALAGWRLWDAAVGDPVDGDEPTDRVRFLAKGVVYLALAIGSLSVTIANWGGPSGGSGGGDGESQRKATSEVLGWPMGQWIVAAFGLGVIGYAIFMCKHHVVDAAFMDRLSTGSSGVRRFGRFGYAARSIVWALVGFLMIRAAITYDPNEAGGLSAALQELAGSGPGAVLLVVVALGLFAFGAFCIAEAKYRRAA